MLQTLKNSRKRIVGLKQTLKAIQADNAEMVFLAQDVDEYIAAKVKDQCVVAGVRLFPVDSMKELGEACGIQVGAAAAAILK